MKTLMLFVVGAVIGAGALYGSIEMNLVPGMSKSEGGGKKCGGHGKKNVLQAAKEAGVLKVGVKGDAPPFGLKEQWEGEDAWSGFDIDIARGVAKELGIAKVEFVQVTSSDRIDRVASGELDMAIASMTITRTREEKVDFSIPYFQDGQALLVAAGSDIDSYETLVGKVVGGAEGSTSLKTIKEVQPDCTVKTFAGGYTEAMEALRAGSIDALTTDLLILKGLLLGAKDAEKFTLLEERFSTEPYGIALPENQSAMRDAVNNALQRLWETGRWQRTYESWFGVNAKYRSDIDFSVTVFPQ